MPDFKPVYEGTPPLLTSMFVQSPRNETLLDMIHYTLFPYAQYSSMTFVWLLLDIFVFCCCFWLDSIHKSSELLKISQKSLFYLGQNSPYHIVYDHHYFRLLTSLVLFRNLYHLTTNLFCILVMGSYVEYIIGWKKTFLLVVLAGVAGELCGTIFNQKVSIEGSTPVCGLIGYLVGVGVLGWRRWERYSNQRFHMLLFLVFMTGVELYSGVIYKNINNVSQAAAIVYGFVYSLLENPQTEQGRCSKLVKTLAFLFIVSTLTMLIIALLFWTYPSRLYV